MSSAGTDVSRSVENATRRDSSAITLVNAPSKSRSPPCHHVNPSLSPSASLACTRCGFYKHRDRRQPSPSGTMEYSRANTVPYPPRPEPPEGPAPSALELPPNGAYLDIFQSLLEPTSVLQKHGYRFQQLTDAEIHEKRRCSNCNQSREKH
jgi:hypothetical protein